MARLWRSRAATLLLGILSLPFTSAEHSFENTAIVRTVELGGSLVHVTTTYAIRALEDGSSTYTLALGEDEQKQTSWIQAKLKGETVPLHLKDFGLNHHTYVSC
jgi:oligosaccharyltransferase complex subunit alpha (ribophorin I)